MSININFGWIIGFIICFLCLYNPDMVIKYIGIAGFIYLFK